MSSQADALGRVYYHHSAHAEWTDRQPHFWFLTSKSFYDRDRVKRVLKDIAEHMDLRSYVTYELIGPYDIMVRVYLKAGGEAREFAKAIKEQLSPQKQTPFVVDEVTRHWIWAGPATEDRGPIVKPKREVLEQRFPRSELALLNAQGDGSVERLALIDQYAELDLVRVNVRGHGIKVAVTVGFDQPLDEQERDQARARLAKWLDKATHPLQERSLYTGAYGQVVQFIVMCRLAHGDFHRIHEWLIEPIGNAVNTVHVRTTTYPIVSADFVCFAEEMALPAETRPDIVTLMRSHELSDFEVKGSLLAPLNPWLKDDEPLTEQAWFPQSSVLKGIVGLLNSGGGTMLVGAVEEKPYRKFLKAITKLRQFPQVGEYYVVGLVDPTYAELGWDVWDRKFHDLLQNAIDPPPGVLVHRRQGELEGQSVCIVQVDEPREDMAYYLKEKGALVYYARVGTSAERLEGPGVDKHRDDMRQVRRAKRQGRTHD